MPISFPIDINISRSDAGSAQSWAVSITGPGVYTAGLVTDNDIVLDAEGVAGRHMTIDLTGDTVMVSSVEPDLPLKINGQFVMQAELKPGDRVELPGHTLSYGAMAAAAPARDVTDAAPAAPRAPEPPPEHRVELSYVLDRPSEPVTAAEEFPGAWFREPERVSVSKIHASGHDVEEIGFLAIGGGLGSFTWVDHLRVYGAETSDIRVVGIDPVCYANYKRYCRNSQIPDRERLRSNSQSTPDNIWGFPGYASRETLSDLARFRVGGLKYVYQVFGEPTVAESFTPRAGRVFDSIEREMTRIGWHDMFLRARAISLRMTDDGRYALAHCAKSRAATVASSGNALSSQGKCMSRRAIPPRVSSRISASSMRSTGRIAATWQTPTSSTITSTRNANRRASRATWSSAAAASSPRVSFSAFPRPERSTRISG
jgi:pSer/pThr/pTyr-binding forkhead associated (FHA) protein